MARGNPPASDPDTLRRMSRQRQQDTKPEAVVRRLVHALGHRYRLRNRDLPGSPDLANRTRRWVIFVHGCYWHAHEGCPGHTIPKRNKEFWVRKFEDNRNRDTRVAGRLASLGFRVVTVWECEIADPPRLADRLRVALSDR